MKRILSLVLVYSMILSSVPAFAEQGTENEKGFFGKAWDSVSGAASTAWDATTGAVENAWDATADFAETAWDATTNAAEVAWDATTGAVETAWDATTGAVETAWDVTTGAVETAWDWTQGAATDAWNWTADVATNVWSATTNAAVGAWNWAGNLIHVIREDSMDALTEAYSITAENLGIDSITAEKIWSYAMEYATAHNIGKEDMAKLTIAALVQIASTTENIETISEDVIRYIQNIGVNSQKSADDAVEALENTLEAASEKPVLDPDEPKYYMGEAVNTGTDNGFSGSNKIGKDDPHFGWALGKFFVSGYTRVSNDQEGNPVFLKTVGDKIVLWFNLEQDILCLDGDSNKQISVDGNGYDEYFGVKQTDFGRGTMIIRHRDYQNAQGGAQIYTDYLSANVAVGADTTVQLFEEGDYEVALNYEIKSTEKKFLSTFNVYDNYRIYFKFSVRNGNCMVYPFDTETGAELTNTALTENGFYLDLARSRYLDINVKRETLAEGAVGLTEDVRFNRPARDGDRYTDEGIYTITVSNRYTGQETVKRIYVGTNKLLMAHMVTGMSIDEIRGLIAKGATITSDGTIVGGDFE
ncbi:MAG: hypothetical protein IKJ65_02170 [Clostridia bacterium]|nr:hypothetical protein [Clostridia bacterium]